MFSIMSSLGRKLLIPLFAVLLAANSAAQTPSAEQLEIFRNLTPEQQQALLEQLAQADMAGSSLLQGEGQGGSQIQDRQVTLRREGQSRREEFPLPKVLEPESTVLVEVSFPSEQAGNQARMSISSLEIGEYTRLIDQIAAR